ncbi:hypothetical protein [Flavobacterium sp.]|uniref:hypothetical protein n=1 Tax=Flavobacterium sp. TaxID=239 RepID=UPI00263A059D|nr:hypothetical protein [Flavobacterium sp.]
MSTTPQFTDGQEIDLGSISNFFKKIGQSFFNAIFKMISFIRRKIVVFVILTLVGVVLGYFYEKEKIYRHDIIVIPNFTSVDYLYSKIELINSRIKDNDTAFLKNTVGIQSPKKIGKITIKPISDVYKFIVSNPQNFELIKLFSEDSDAKKIVEDEITSKNYPFHVISFNTKGLTEDKKTITPILNYLNNSDFYKKIQEENLKNVYLKMAQNDSIINQINGILNGFKNTSNGNQRNSSLVYYNENTQLNDIIKTKEALIKENGNFKVELVSLDKVIKENSIVSNIKDDSLISAKIAFPLFFYFCFILFYRYTRIKKAKKLI